MVTASRGLKRPSLARRCWRDRQLLLLLLPGLLFYIIFRYGPMYGLVIAFKKYSPFLGVEKSPWVGLKYFEQFFSSQDFGMLFKNTLMLGALSMIVGFPAPIIFALLLNEVRQPRTKKVFQTVSYLPHFLSVVIVCSIFTEFFSPSSGLVNRIIVALGGKPIYFLASPGWYRFVYIVSDLWAGLGSGAIIYLAALSAVDQQLYEAAAIDGCTRFKMIWYIALPSIVPTIVTMFLLRCGQIMNIAADKTLLLYSPLTYEVADIFSTYVYRMGLLNKNYSFASAVGMFTSLLSGGVLLIANTVSKRSTGNSLW